MTNISEEDLSNNVPAEEDPEVLLGKLKSFTVSELQVATDNFSDKNMSGKDGVWMVFKGRLTDGSQVAVKRLNESTAAAHVEFQTEIELTHGTVHRNLLKPRGFCIAPSKDFIVYPDMPNGNVTAYLRERQSNKPPLDWTTRKGIALGSARGLSYLHCGYMLKIIHLDVKSANIFLDEEFEAVVGGLGRARLICYDEDVRVNRTCRGTIGYMAPEYLCARHVSEKTDVFGYGVVLLELITGLRLLDIARLANDEDVIFLDWVKGLVKEKKLEALVDPDLQNSYVEAEMEQLIQVALLCMQSSPMERPKMSEVVRMLEGDDGLAERWDEWQKAEVLRHEVELAPNSTSGWIKKFLPYF